MRDEERLSSAIRLYKASKRSLSEEDKVNFRSRIHAIAKELSATSHAHAHTEVTDVKPGSKKKKRVKRFSLSNLVGTQRLFDESKHRREGGRFAPKGTKSPKPTTQATKPESESKPQTAKQIIEGLGVGSTFSIPGIDGTIERTEDGYIVTGPGGFETTASTAVAAMAIASRLIRESKKTKRETK